VDRSARGTESESRLRPTLSTSRSALGHADRRTPFRSYCAGLIRRANARAVEPMAARVEPGASRGASISPPFCRQRRLVAGGPAAGGSDPCLPAIEKSGKVRAWIVDDTGFPKERRSFGRVARQYCGQLGKQDNCQIAVSLSGRKTTRVCRCLSTLSFRELGRRSGSSSQGRRARRRRLQDQAAIALDQNSAAARATACRREPS